MASAFDRNEQLSNQRAKITVGIERLSTAFRATLWEEAKNYNFSPLQLQIILFVAFHEARQCNITNIAREFAVTKATVSDAVRVLIEKDFLKKITSDDARAFFLELTASGKKCVNKLSGLTEFFNSSLSEASNEEIEKIWEGLLLLISYLQKTDIIPVRMCFNCKHFQSKTAKEKTDYCKLMQKPLQIKDIRLDCSEHSFLSKFNAK